MKQLYLILILFFMQFAIPLNAQQTAMKSNVLFWAATTPNLGVEVGITERFTLDIGGAYNAWKFKNNMKLNLYLIQPEFRYWPCQKFEGHFFGIHGHFGHYNIGQIPFISGMKELVYRGDLYGGGVSYDYHWVLGERWGMEVTGGVGYTSLEYDKIRCADCGETEGHYTRTFIGPTRIGFSVIYFLR